MSRVIAWLLSLGLVWGGSAFAAGNYPPHQGGSPWSFDEFGEPSSTYIVNDTDSPTLDRYLDRGEGPILVQIPIRRYVGPTDDKGHLLNSNDFIKRGIVGSTATIRLPAFDVDRNEFPINDCDGDGTPDQLKNEEDKLYLNDEEIGILGGDDEIWLSQAFEVPISKLKFPSAPGKTALNIIKIEIDAANKEVILSSGAKGCTVWAVSIDWVGLSFEAQSPVVLVHGIKSSGENLSDFEQGLKAQGIQAVDRSITMPSAEKPDPLPPGCPSIPYNNSIQANVDYLGENIPAIAEHWGSETLHFVTHSKGGLDIRGVLSESIARPLQVTVGEMGGQLVKRDLEARSLVTLNTPHQGSVLANLGVASRTPGIPGSINVWAAQSFEGPYYCDLTIERTSNFVSSTTIPNGVQTVSVATDADTNNDGQIDSKEGTPIPFGDRFYQLVGNIKTVTVTVSDDGRTELKETPHDNFHPNDLIVTQESARLYTPLVFETAFGNHITVHSRQNAERIARIAQGNGGPIDWRLR